MGVFQSAFKAIGEQIGDLTSLDIVTFKGSIEADMSATNMPDTFEKVLNLAKGNADMKIKLLASTQVKLDGDILVYFDNAITLDEAKAHAELLSVAQKTREATVNFVASIVGLKDIDIPSTGNPA